MPDDGAQESNSVDDSHVHSQSRLGIGPCVFCHRDFCLKISFLQQPTNFSSFLVVAGKLELGNISAYIKLEGRSRMFHVCFKIKKFYVVSAFFSLGK